MAMIFKLIGFSILVINIFGSQYYNLASTISLGFLGIGIMIWDLKEEYGD